MLFWLPTLICIFGWAKTAGSHAKLLCPSLSPWVCSNSCPLSQWCHLNISSSVAPISSCPQFFPTSGFFQWVGSSHQVAKILELQLQHQSFQWIFRVDFLSDWLVQSPCCPKASQESSPTPQFQSVSSLTLSLLYGSTPHPYMTTGKTIVLMIRMIGLT